MQNKHKIFDYQNNSNKPRRKILPVFLPFAGCANRCIYCNQHAIANTAGAESLLLSAGEQIDKWKNISPDWDELAFYGGTFGNLPADIRKALYLLADGLGIRYSTCPETVSDELAAEMSVYNITTVELGVQSFSDNVLAANKRGYRQKDIFAAFARIPKGVKKACQLMVGMYGEERADVALAAEFLPATGVDYVRIYPTVVLKDTLLADYLRDGSYVPLPPEEVLLRTAWVYMHAQTDFSRVIRIGLPPEAEDSGMIAGGWWHPACGELVRTMLVESWLRINKSASIPFHQALYGYKGILKNAFKELKLIETDINTAVNRFTADLREHYREDRQWFTERAAFEFAARLCNKADIG